LKLNKEWHLQFAFYDVDSLPFKFDSEAFNYDFAAALIRRLGIQQQ
jgi:hypothetical protein